MGGEGAVDAVEAGLGGFAEGVLPDADDFPSLTSKLTSDAFIAGHVVLPFFIPEGAVGFGPGVALGAAVPEPSLWEQTRKTTEGSPKGVAPFAGKQMPSTIRRRRWRPSAWGTAGVAVDRSLWRSTDAEARRRQLKAIASLRMTFHPCRRRHRQAASGLNTSSPCLGYHSPECGAVTSM